MTTALDEAKEIIFGDREQTYGDPAKNLTVIANYWEMYLRSRGMWNEDSEGMFHYDVCRMMSLLKLARLGNSPEHRDSSVDMLGYEALADRVMRPDGKMPVPLRPPANPDTWLRDPNV